ncbi:MAG: hydroxymethylbilane synthase, partial [Deltaproteobacteria bacterium HGW-Deltaproteobacteria-11]
MEGILETNVLKIGTRGSALALKQSGWVADRIRERHPGLTVELVVIKT